MTHFASAKTDGDLDLSAGLDELDSVVELGIEIMRIAIQRMPGVLDLDGMLTFSGFLLSLCLFKAIFAIVHDLADRRLCLRGNLNQIKVLLLCDIQGVPCRHDSQLLTVRADDPYLFVTNFLVDLSVVFFLADD